MTSTIIDLAASSSYPAGFRLEVQGRPIGKGRPRFNRETGRAYTDWQTRSREERIHTQWIAAGKPFLHGALEMTVTMFVARPGSHYRVGGELSKAGVDRWHPTGRPDVDNALKLVCDALNGLGYADDRQIIRAHVERRWCERGHPELTVIRVDALEEQPLAS